MKNTKQKSMRMAAVDPTMPNQPRVYIDEGCAKQNGEWKPAPKSDFNFRFQNMKSSGFLIN